jgi:hypothetical protein
VDGAAGYERRVVTVLSCLRSSVAHARAWFAAEAHASDRWEAARVELAAAGTALARMLQEQILFEDAWTVAEEIAEEIGPRDDPATAWLRLRAGIARSLFSDDSADVAPAARAAIDIAERSGEVHLDLEARTTLHGMGGLGPAEMARETERLVALALRLGRPDVAARSLRIGATATADLGLDWEPMLDRSAQIAQDHGLLEPLGWVEYTRGELAFSEGRWDAALASTSRSIELGIRHAYHRIVVRSWYVATPIAIARNDLPLLRRAHDWHESMRPYFPDSPFGRLMHRGFDLRAARAGLGGQKAPDVDWLLPSFEQEPEMASWLDAADEILRHWLEHGELDAVGDALGRMGAMGGQRTRWSIGAREVMRSRLLLARGEAAAATDVARAALPVLRPVRSTWWIAKALRLIERAGGAASDEIDEARSIEVRLGAIAPAP